MIEAHAKGMQNTTNPQQSLLIGSVNDFQPLVNLVTQDSLMNKENFRGSVVEHTPHGRHSFTQFIIHYLNSGRSHRSTMYKHNTSIRRENLC